MDFAASVLVDCVDSNLGPVRGHGREVTEQPADLERVRPHNLKLSIEPEEVLACENPVHIAM